MNNVRQHFDTGSVLVIFITLVLFGVALFEKGLTHDLLLEAGVFLVSVKLILMIYKNGIAAAALQAKLDQLLRAVERIESRKNSPPA